MDELLSRLLSDISLPKASANAEASQASPIIGHDVLPDVAGNQVNLTREEKGMAATVTWHRDFAVAGYIEIEYELAPWAEYAKRFQDKNGLLMPPLLPLMAWRLIQIVQEKTRLNATMVGNKRFEYTPVNLGIHYPGRRCALLGSGSQCAQGDDDLVSSTHLAMCCVGQLGITLKNLKHLVPRLAFLVWSAGK
jgi:hypothetical protein